MATTPSLTAAELCAVAGLGDPAKSLLRDGISPREYTNALIEEGQFPDAVRVIAHALPKREAVWWAWMSARRAVPSGAAAQNSALAATETWIAQPTDENRRTAMKAGDVAGADTPAGCAAFAAFFTGGSLAPPDLQPVPPGPHDTAKAVAGAVIMAAVVNPEKAHEAFEAFLKQGLEVTTRIKLW